MEMIASLWIVWFVLLAVCLVVIIARVLWAMVMIKTASDYPDDHESIKVFEQIIVRGRTSMILYCCTGGFLMLLLVSWFYFTTS
ncbi:MAG: hypothetical protein WC310_02690 [Patescibacteria group bacterium]|jgi:hypothetical protein